MKCPDCLRTDCPRPAAYTIYVAADLTTRSGDKAVANWQAAARDCKDHQPKSTTLSDLEARVAALEVRLPPPAEVAAPDTLLIVEAEHVREGEPCWWYAVRALAERDRNSIYNISGKPRASPRPLWATVAIVERPKDAAPPTVGSAVQDDISLPSALRSKELEEALASATLARPCQKTTDLLHTLLSREMVNLGEVESARRLRNFLPSDSHRESALQQAIPALTANDLRRFAFLCLDRADKQEQDEAIQWERGQRQQRIDSIANELHNTLFSKEQIAALLTRRLA